MSYPKLPEDPWSKKEIEPIYGRTFGWKGPNGEAEIRYSDVENPDKFSWQKMEATGSFSTLSANDQEKQNNTDLNVGNQYCYVADGSSSQIDGHKDTNCMSTERVNCMGDRGVSGLKNYTVYTGGRVTAVQNDVKIVYAASGSFSGVGTFGDQVNEHSGNWHEAFEKDKVQAVGGNKITMVEGGDYAIHVQSGNYDAHIQQKGRIYSESDLLIESASKITLKVGASTIVITAGSIDMNSPAIFLN